MCFPKIYAFAPQPHFEALPEVDQSLPLKRLPTHGMEISLTISK